MRQHEFLDISMSLFPALLLATAIAVSGCDKGTNNVDDGGDEDEPSPDLSLGILSRDASPLRAGRMAWWTPTMAV